MPGGGGIVMALRMTRLAGLLMFSNVLASDMADGSTNDVEREGGSFINIYFFIFFGVFLVKIT